MDQRLPMLRGDLQFLPAQAGDRQLIAVRDPLGLSEQVALLPPELVGLLELFDGRHTLGDLQLVLTRAAGGRLVRREEVERLVAELDGLLLLRTGRYEARLARRRAEWTALPVRPAAHAGGAYPAEAAGLRSFLDDILARAAGAEPAPARLRAVIAPHIDLRIGAEVYARAYGPLRGLGPRRLIVLGTGHALERPYSLATRPYQTPLGTSPVDRDALAALAAAAGPQATDDFAHRSEHAVEFQVLFLQHLFGPQVPLVALLCGSLHEHLAAAERPADIPELAAVAEALASLADPDSLLVAGVDLCHVGPKFGHPQPAAALEPEFRAHDRNLLAAIEAGSARRLWTEARRETDRFHVCGLPVLALLLSALEGLAGRQLGYEVWHEAATRSAVSYAALWLSQSSQ